MFNLEFAIETWMHSMRLERPLNEDDLAELEDHLRNHVGALISEGASPEEAFRAASTQLGGRLEIGKAYQDVFWLKARHQGKLKAEILAKLAISAHYLRVAFRTVKRQKLQAVLNVFGLSLAFSACVIIGLYVHDELRFDNFHSNVENLYRVSASWGGDPFATSTMKMGPAMQDEFGGIDSYTRLYRTEKLVQYEGKRFEIKNAFYSDSTLWNVFDFELITGSERNVLVRPNAIVLTETVARRLFGTDEAVGKQITLDNSWSGEITGVVADPPAQSHIQFEALVSMATAEQQLPTGLWEDWFWTEAYTYVRLKKGISDSDLSPRFPDFQERIMGVASREQESDYDIFLEPLSGLYLNSSSAIPIGPVGSATRVSIFLTIGILILILAIINFTNLATASSIMRAREIGVRKSVGAHSTQLTSQFLMESVVTCVFAFVLSLAIAGLSLSSFSELAGKHLSLEPLFDPLVIGALLSIVMTVGIGAGFYPAIVLSRTQSVSVLKGHLPLIGAGNRSRRLLVVAQFSSAIVLVAGALLVRQQLAFVTGADLGIKEENVLVIDTSLDAEIQQATARIKQALLADPAVASVTTSSDPPGSNRNSARTVIEDEFGQMNVNYSKLYFVDEDFAATYGLEFVAGRNFSRDHATDSTSAMIINERAAMVFAYDPPSDAIGKRFRQWGTEGTIVGVYKDFHFTSLHDHIRPLSMRIDPSENRFMSLKLATNNLGAAIERLEAIWSKQVPHRPMSFRFLDDRLDALYTAETRFSTLIGVFAFLATLIGCLGLFGLASLMAAQRSSEIGIRKVMGASVSRIIFLLSKETTAMITLSFAIAVPIIWIYGSRWLDNFFYRIEMPWTGILFSGALALLIAWGTIGHSVSAAARANPVDTLRNE